MTMDRHPTTAHWTFPPAERAPLAAPLRRTNLRELAARPDRFEHHLMVVARVGVAQLEIATASEPLYFAHRNISDEYAVPMTTGDAMADAIPFRTFVSSFDTGADLARINHGPHQLVLHPYGFLHWPGRLRPPYAPFPFGPGMRRCGYSAVLCGGTPVEPAPERPLFVSPGCEAGAKQYTGADVPVLIADLARDEPRAVAAVGDVTAALIVDPVRLPPERGGYLLVIDGDGAHFPGDLVCVPAGAELPAAGLRRALLITGPDAPEPPPASWDTAPPPPFAVYEDADPGALPIAAGTLTVAAASDTVAIVRIGDGAAAEVPRYWLARMLFRVALHDYRLGYVETYGGFYYDDTTGAHRFGVRGGGSIELDRIEIAAAVERIYRAVAPPGYVERLA
jgi:hypothetical protein